MVSTSLVTGGAGFIGAHLTRALRACGDTVIVVDDLSTGRAANLTGLDIELHAADLGTLATLEQLVARADRVFHLAAAVGVALIAARPVEVMRRNVIAADRLLELCARHQVRLLITSSSEVYGPAADGPLREDQPVVLGPSASPRWAYGCSKLTLEHHAFAWRQMAGLPLIIARLFNTTGPGQRGDFGMVVPRLTRQALTGEDLTVYGDGNQQRCFCHVDDVVSGLLALIETPAAYGEVVNLGNDEPVTIEALAERILALTGSRSVIRRIPFAEAYTPGFEDIQRRRPDLSRARALIGYAPRRSLDMILREVINAQRQELSM